METNGRGTITTDVVIVGAGPAGIFCALGLLGIAQFLPVLIENVFVLLGDVAIDALRDGHALIFQPDGKAAHELEGVQARAWIPDFGRQSSVAVVKADDAVALINQ